MGETLQQWAERAIPLCPICNTRHDDNPVLQDNFHSVQRCSLCGNDHARVEDCLPMKTEATNTYEALALSSIYQQLLNSLESEIDQPQGRFKTRTHQEQIQLVSDAVGQALQLLSARCSRCDAGCLPMCTACIIAAQQAATKLSVEEEGHQESW